MKIYITRHGQVDLKAKYLNGNIMLPVGEVALSELGEQQAVLVGKRLKELGFQGKILASPLLRTMRTAELIAKETGSEIWPTGWMHEIFNGIETLSKYRGYSIEELREMYTCISEKAELSYPWWPDQLEDSDAVMERVSRGIAALLEADTDEEFLLVGHGASVIAVHKYLQLGGDHTWNCCLGMYDSKHPEENYGRDVSFMPKEMVSSNIIMATDVNFGIDFPVLYRLDVPAKLRYGKGQKLLYIHDSNPGYYWYYRQLINAVKPDIIMQEGRIVEEILQKAGEPISGTNGAEGEPCCRVYVLDTGEVYSFSLAAIQR